MLAAWIKTWKREVTAPRDPGQSRGFISVLIIFPGLVTFKRKSDLKDQLVQSRHLQLKTASLEADAYSTADVGPGWAPDLHNSFSLYSPHCISQDERCGWSFPPGLCIRAIVGGYEDLGSKALGSCEDP